MGVGLTLCIRRQRAGGWLAFVLARCVAWECNSPHPKAALVQANITSRVPRRTRSAARLRAADDRPVPCPRRCASLRDLALLTSIFSKQGAAAAAPPPLLFNFAVDEIHCIFFLVANEGWCAASLVGVLLVSCLPCCCCCCFRVEASDSEGFKETNPGLGFGFEKR